MRAHARAGFTLPEVMIASFMLAGASVVTLKFLTTESDQFEVAMTQADVNVATEQAVDAMVRELRSATRKTGASPPDALLLSPTQLRFFLPVDADGNGNITTAATGAIEWDAATPVIYQLDAATGRLVRTAGAATRTLALNVTSVLFTDQTTDASLGPNEIRVQLTIQRVTPHGRPVGATLSGVARLVN
jgi:prepilin-type N-terminal cleavage/methylation domain-containing protein